MKKWALITVPLIAAILIVVLYPNKLHYSLEVAGKVLPFKDVTVSKSADGVLSVVLNNNLLGTEETLLITELQRGDAMSFSLNPAIYDGNVISEGDTVGWVESSETQRELETLYSDLAIENATLALLESGEKESIIEEYSKLVDAARERLSEQERITERLKTLSEQDYISAQEYELSLNQRNLYRIDVYRAEAQLESARTGVKPEEIDLVHARISGIEREIASLEDKLSRYTILSPFDGIVLNTSSISNAESNQALFTISDFSEYYVTMPVKLKNREYIKPGQKTMVKVENIKEALQGEITSIGSVVRVVGDEQVVMVTASCGSSDHDLFAGTVARCNIELEPVSLLEYCCRSINTTFNR